MNNAIPILLSEIEKIDCPKSLASALIEKLNADVCFFHIRPRSSTKPEGEFLDIEYRSNIPRGEVLRWLGALVTRQNDFSKLTPSGLWKIFISEGLPLTPLLVGVTDEDNLPNYPCLLVSCPEFHQALCGLEDCDDTYKPIRREEIQPLAMPQVFSQPTNLVLKCDATEHTKAKDILSIAEYHLASPFPMSFVSIPIPIKDAYSKAHGNAISVDVSWFGRPIPKSAKIPEAILLALVSGTRVAFKFSNSSYGQFLDFLKSLADLNWTSEIGHVDDYDIPERKGTARELPIWFPCHEVFTYNNGAESFKSLYCFREQQEFPDYLHCSVFIAHVKYLGIEVDVCDDCESKNLKLPYHIGILFVLGLAEFLRSLNKNVADTESVHKIFINIPGNNKAELGIPMKSPERFWDCFHTGGGGRRRSFSQTTRRQSRIGKAW